MRIFPGSWCAEEDRPYAGEFRLRLVPRPGREPEAGLSAYRESMVSCDQVLTSAQRLQGYGLIRLRVSDFLDEGLFVVCVPDETDPTIGRARAEIRVGSRSGGQQISNSRRDRIARRAGAPECIVVRASSTPEQKV